MKRIPENLTPGEERIIQLMQAFHESTSLTSSKVAAMITDQIRGRDEIMEKKLDKILEQTVKTNDRVTTLELARAQATGGVNVIRFFWGAFGTFLVAGAVWVTSSIYELRTKIIELKATYHGPERS
jgi:hypothetical protein